MTAPRKASDGLIDHIAVFCGPIAQLCFIIFLPAGGMLPPISPSRTPLETANHYRKHEVGMKAGVTFMFLSGIFWPIFCAGINRQLSRIPNINPLFLWAQLAGGSLGAMSMMLPGIFFATTIYRLDRDPVLTQMLSDLSWFSFALLFPPFVAQDLAISSAILSDKRPNPLFPHWLAHTMTGLTFTLYPALGCHCVYGGIVAWNGGLGFWAGAAGFGLQVGLLVMYLQKAIARSDDDDEGISS